MTHPRPTLRLWAPLQRLAAAAMVLLAVACATVAPPPRPAASPPPGPPVRLPLPPVPQTPFQTFLGWARTAALAESITPATFDRATAGIAPIPAIAGMNANQPEFAKPVWSYLDSAASPRRVKDGQAMLAQYGPALDAIAAKSGVPKEILLAVWGMETDFGHDNGGFNLFAALATLAYDGPRAAYAKPEFLAALHILQDHQYAVSDMTASWAGAFGQTQFTPTTFLKYAADGDGDGKIDLWHSPADALASAANLLASQGWQRDQSWGYEVALPRDFAYENADLDIVKTVSEWNAIGVRAANGAPLPPSDISAAIYLPAGARGPALLILPDFRVILKYNNAASYALGVAVLADRIMGRAPILSDWPRDERPLSHNERVTLQTDLTALGFDTGAPDGVLGRKTCSAARAYQKSRGLLADGYPTAALLAMAAADMAKKSAP